MNKGKMMKKVFMVLMLTGLLGGCAVQSTSSEGGEGDAFVLVAKADKAYGQSDWKTAEQAYRVVIAKVPNDGYAYFRLGNTLAKQYHFDDAVKAYQEALLRDEKKTKIYNNLAMIHLLQAQSTLSAGLKTIPARDGNAAQVKHMLWQLKKITRVNLQEIKSPVDSQ